ncbi:MAG: hypothetical protein DI585_04125 [Pseudomonas fluorescens]|nr:MAG: hypothetical protein DI585_04125 [Pseudomonas fluorescens]
MSRSLLTTSPVTQALNLKAAGIFRLLVLTTALLCGVIALGAASAAMLQGLYTSWQLERSGSLTVYLPPEADNAAVQQLAQSLPTLQGVTRAEALAPQQVRAWLGPIAQENANLPLPTVLEIGLTDSTDLNTLTAQIRQAFPVAEIDDHKPLLEQVGGAVRSLQTSIAGLAVAMLALMALLITLTTRTGLQAQSSTLHLLVQLGAHDGVITRSVCTQVLGRTLAGYALGTATAGVLLLAASQFMPALSLHIGVGTITALLIAPLLLPALALGTAALTTRNLLHKLT